MPPAVYALMWRYLKAGKSWMGIVKNRCRNGDYYWVNAYVTPILEGGRVVGYESVRVCPTREQVARAEALYARLRNGQAAVSVPRRLNVLAQALALPLAGGLLALGANQLWPGLVGQGLTLPWLIRTLRLGTDPGIREEEARARQRLLEAATRRLDELDPVWPGHRPLLDQLRETYRHRSEHVERQRNASDGDGEDRELIEHREIRRTVIGAEREALLRLRAEGEVSDEVLRDLERELDLEERRMDA